MTFRQCIPVAVGFAFLFAAGAAASQAQALKIGVFDAQRITQDTAEGAKIQARLNAVKEKKGSELKKLQEDIEKLQQEFVQSATSATEDKKRDLGLRIQRKQDELDSAQKNANRELQMEVEAAQEGWQRRVVLVVNAYGKEKGFTLIVPSDVALFYAPEIDITPDLIKLIDSGAGAPAPAQAAPAQVPAPSPAGAPPKTPPKK